jgi:hypothetical protein
LEAVLAEAQRLYDAPAMKKQAALHEEGAQEVANLRTTLDKLPEVQPPALSAADAQAIADIRGDLTGEPVAQEMKGPKRFISSKAALPEGMSTKEARPIVDKAFADLVTALRKLATDKGFRVEEATSKDGASATAKVINPATGKPVIMAKKTYEGHGNIRIENFEKKFIEDMDFVSPPKNEAPPPPNRTARDALEWRLPENQRSGMAPPIELTRKLGTDTGRVGDMRGIRNASIEEIVARIPKEAELRELPPRPDGGATMGFEYQWRAVNAEGMPTTMKVRVHGIDSLAPAGSNASKGWVVVVEKGNSRMDGGGTFQESKYLVQTLPDGRTPNPSYNPDLANNTHIPIKNPANPLPPVFPAIPRDDRTRAPLIPPPAP